MFSFVTQERDREGLLSILLQELRAKGWEASQRNPTCNYAQISGLVATRPSLILLEISTGGGVPTVVSSIREGCPQAQIILLCTQLGNDALVQRLQQSYEPAAIIVIPPYLLEKEGALREHLQKQVPPGPALVGAGSCV